ncbi:MFS transporter, SP family, sugar:H+ symporter [Geosmithia morbida]|uniref:MFS transporter, SP family, sugar:H+ symporter n=1 Tax=Geosmithia morbida TaxID=1094350 RepID=A0A9P4YQ93_9HYPO|nr:MFS transporter, SP family, sugar:H+ symporter [Geosmithia morbida]KAF4119799.1 MFS transporter, SP family, sugar:H+ symporter [Geosmithia morbida]
MDRSFGDVSRRVPRRSVLRGLVPLRVRHGYRGRYILTFEGFPSTLAMASIRAQASGPIRPVCYRLEVCRTMTTELTWLHACQRGGADNAPTAFFSCFFIRPFVARFGHLQHRCRDPDHQHALPSRYVACVIGGVGVGMATVIIPAYSAEMAPKNIRGTLGSMFQFFFTLGVVKPYWIDYAVQKYIPVGTRQWQTSVGLQLVPGAILGLGMLLTKESTRRLAKQGRHEEAIGSLT